MAVTAKLCDFGLSLGYSDPWTAPEAQTARGFDALKRAEICSFGMLFWTVILDGRQFESKNHQGWLQEHRLNSWNQSMTSDNIVALKAES